MAVHFKKVGSGFPLLILHGLFGSGDNWQGIAKVLSETYTVYTLDLPNHGQSSHLSNTEYPFLAKKIHEFMNIEGINKAHICGHSMGGKVAMQLAHDYPDRIQNLVIADIAPKAYEPHHQEIINGIEAVASAHCSTRQDAENVLSEFIDNKMLRMWLLKSFNLKDGYGNWMFNYRVLIDNYLDIAAKPVFKNNITTPTTFIRGGDSDYILDSDLIIIDSIFDNAKLETIKHTGHWLHAQKPKDFITLLLNALN